MPYLLLDHNLLKMNLLVSCLMLVGLLGFAQESTIVQALKTNDAATILNLMSDKSEIYIAAHGLAHDRQKAEKILNSFFTQEQVTTLKIIHRGEAKDKSSQYFIGRMTTTQTAVYRIFIQFNTTDNLISEIRIDKE